MALNKPNLLGVAILSTLFCANAFGHGQVVRGPVDDSGLNDSEVIDGEGLLEANAAMTPFVTSKGMETLTYARVDTSNGTMGGYAGMTMTSSAVLDLGTDALGASAGSILQVQDFTVVNNGGGAAVVDATFEFEFHGTFATHSGTPTLDLSGVLSVVTLDQFIPPTIPEGRLFISTLSFVSTALSGGAVEILTESEESDALTSGVISSPFAGTSFEILGSDASNLHAIIRMVVPLATDDVFTVVANLIGLAAPEPDPNDSDIEDGISVLASSGAVDFSNTGSLRILLPEGYSFQSADPLLGNVTIATTPVPLPASLLLMAPALAVLARRRGRRANDMPATSSADIAIEI
ncbi:MAG: hypothetical protein H6978_08840 [Gammaproteobacteria bacterium]|nr:hypothetical protein [Gammaproteobacteria bacterium]